MSASSLATSHQWWSPPMVVSPIVGELGMTINLQGQSISVTQHYFKDE